VKNNGSKLFKDIVLKYLNDKYNSNWSGSDKLSLYGYDGNLRSKGGITTLKGMKEVKK